MDFKEFMKCILTWQTKLNITGIGAMTVRIRHQTRVNHPILFNIFDGLHTYARFRQITATSPVV